MHRGPPDRGPAGFLESDKMKSKVGIFNHSEKRALPSRDRPRDRLE